MKALQGQVRALTDNLRRQVTAGGGLRDTLRAEYADARVAGRTGRTFEGWAEDRLDQAAVAWVLGCVFVRFCEDNELVERRWIGGADPAALAERAMRGRQAHLVANPLHNDRHWLREAFGYLAGLGGAGTIFDHYNPVWHVDISGDAAEDLSDFFRRGPGAASLRTSALDTRFLGDLYEELSAHARDTYALRQTPEFVEEFILDRTFEPALRDFGLAAMAVIDPTCGSGHFLLGSFGRLVRLWGVREPATDARVLVERALGQVTGVDINAFAVAIARFRLMIAALQACGLSSLERAPTFPIRVATGDSLLEWGDRSSHQGDLLAAAEGRPEFAYYTEDGDALAEYLRPGTYTVVVGNPPYITVKDKTLNRRYRGLYSACSGTYAMSVPFAQRFFGLAKQGDNDGDGAGWVGQITANSFMKREFGKKLINAYFRNEVELGEIVDTSKAIIPGHVATVILVGRNRAVSSRYSGPMRTLLGVSGEPGQPPDPRKGVVWTAIVNQIDEPGSDSDWVSSADLPRDRLHSHPWSLSGGGASDLMAIIGASPGRLSEIIDGAIGFASFPGQDDAFFAPAPWFARRRIPADLSRPLVAGDTVRDWTVQPTAIALVPYDRSLEALPFDDASPWGKHLWTSRRILQSTTGFDGETRADVGDQWWSWYRWVPSRYRSPRLITFAEVATHNHFALDPGGTVFKQTAPVIKLSAAASEDDYLRLLGLLNSSVACFWLKQLCFPKGGSGMGRGIQPEGWMERYAFNASNLDGLPCPSDFTFSERAPYMNVLARRLLASSSVEIFGGKIATRERLSSARSNWDSTRAKMISVQEEMDWEVYGLYGLVNTNLTVTDPPGLTLGERAFEIVLARQIEAGEVETQWFDRHGSTQITEVPEHWPEEYRAIVERRIQVIESNRNIALIERPECKRRWVTEGWDAIQAAALRDWLLDRLEAPELWGGDPTPLSVAQLADRVRHNEDFRSMLDLWVGTDQHDLTRSLTRLVADEHVPYLPVDRYKPAGLRKRVEWERTWALQRREDAGAAVDIAVPTKYTSADFIKPSYWRNRGKLDVPKERFVSYPGAGRDGDPTLLLSWAGWDHLAQARALATVYLDRKTNAAWPADRLLRLLAGLAEVEPWLRQWHGPQAGFFTGLIDTELTWLEADRATLATVRGLEGLA